MKLSVRRRAKSQKEFQSKQAHISWHGIAAQRHALAHEYGEIDHEKIWRVVTTHMRALRRQLEDLLPPLPPDDEAA